jgi:glucose-6-phosphate dehydrogenase assembly protein OpcA
VALHRRDTSELLSEELRRLDPDEVYAETIAPFGTAHAGAKRAGSRRRGVEAAGQAVSGGNAAGGSNRK